MAQSVLSSSRSFWRWALLCLLSVIIVNLVVGYVLARLRPSYCVKPSHVPSYVEKDSVRLLTAPRQLYLAIDTPLLPLADKDIVVRSAYINTHPSNSRYKNSTVILIEVKKFLLKEKAIQSCRIGDHISKTFETVAIGHSSCDKKATHSQVLLYCYNVPAKHMDWAWVSYRKNLFGGESTYSAKSEHPVMLTPRKKGSNDVSVLVCAVMLPYYTPYIDQWLQYQMTVGIDHVHMTLESSFLNRGSFDRYVLQDHVESGYVSVDFWHHWLNETDICDHSLDLAFLDCALHYRNTFSHVLFIDTRDFFIPRDSNRLQLKEYISQWCKGTHCQLKWRDLDYSKCVHAGDDGNVTSAVHITAYNWREEAVVIHKLSHLVPNKKGIIKLDSTTAVDVPADAGYMGHLVKKGASTKNTRIMSDKEVC